MSHYPYRLLMDETKQLELIKEFMLRLAPEVVRHRYHLIREAEEPYNVVFDPEKIAETTLFIAMHLAATYGHCYDKFQSEADNHTAR